ncbi:MAG: hypothetical protein ABI690_12550 [Chloroflexota bacterium]
MGDDIRSAIEALKSSIDRKQTEARKLEAEVTKLERELDEFRAQYERIIRPVEGLLDAIKGAIEELENQRRAAYFADAQPLESWTAPGEYESVEDQYKRVWGNPTQAAREQPSAEPKPRDSDDSEDAEAKLKRLFRALARRYHPDFAADEGDRVYRTRLMAMINEAYAAHDTGTLQTLMDQDEHVSADVPLSVLHLRDLKQSAAALERRITNLESERSALLHSEMMTLKVEYKLARLKGRDLLREMAAELEQDYWTQVAHLDQLRSKGSG